jgi:nucleotide-binding universal stress UspA family protein
MMPPRTVLAAVDFSEGSRAALTLAARTAVQCGAALHVLYAADPLLSAAARHHGSDLGAESLEELRRFTADTWPTATCNPRLHVITGNAPDVVLDIAARENADLVVVGSRGMSGAERLLFGSTTEYVLRRADVSVLVVPPDWTPATAESRDLSGSGPVVAAVDFSASSVLAAGAASWLAGAIDTTLDVIHVVPAPRVLARWQAGADTVLGDQMVNARRELAAIVHGLGATVPVQTIVESGDAARQIAARVATYASGRPLVVLGRRAGGSRGAAPGAVAYRVLGEAGAPVLVYLGAV